MRICIGRGLFHRDSIGHYGYLNLGFKKIPKSFVTSNVNYLLCGTKLLMEKWNTPQWKTYWIYIYIRQMCRWDEKGWQYIFDFHGAFVSGQEAVISQSIRPVLHYPSYEPRE